MQLIELVQQFLLDKGMLNHEANGNWTAQTQQAYTYYAQSQNLHPALAQSQPQNADQLPQEMQSWIKDRKWLKMADDAQTEGFATQDEVDTIMKPFQQQATAESETLASSGNGESVADESVNELGDPPDVGGETTEESEVEEVFEVDESGLEKELTDSEDDEEESEEEAEDEFGDSDESSLSEDEDKAST